MTQGNEEFFINKLYDVVKKLSGIVKTQSYRFQQKWNEYLKPLNEKPYIIREIPIEKDKFLNDLDYRIKTLNTVKVSFEDGFHSIKTLLNTLYHHYFENSELFLKDFSKSDQILLKYSIAKEILGNLIQYNIMDHETIPLKYNIIARNYVMIKLKGMRDTEILENLKKIHFKLTLPELKKKMKEIIEDGIISKKRIGRYLYYYLEKDIMLSEKGEKTFNINLRSLITWPTELWRSFYNIRELNITVDQNCRYHDFLNEVLSKSATQGYSASHYVFKNLINYYERIRDETK